MAEYISPDAEASVPGWVAFCGTLAPFSSILMFLSPIPTIRQVLRSGTVGDLPLLPYTSMVASCFVWIVYGILKGEPLIWVVNLIEFVLSVYYFVEFTNYAPKQSPTFPGSVYSHIKLCIGIWVCSVWIAIFFSSAETTIGDLTVLLTIFTFASPLAAVKAVLESQSSESIPWPFTLAALFNCILWTIVGVFEMNDIYVYFPEVLGILLSLVQVGLKLHFGDHMNQDNPSYTRAPVEMPYPVLGTVRQVVMLGNSVAQQNHFYENANDLQFDSNMPNTDYMEMGVPLTNNSNDLSPQSASTMQQQQQQQPPPIMASSMEFANPLSNSHLQQPHHKHRKSNDGLEYSAVEGLQTIVFDDDTASPPPTASLRDSFRSRSGSNNAAGHSHGL